MQTVPHDLGSQRGCMHPMQGSSATRKSPFCWWWSGSWTLEPDYPSSRLALRLSSNMTVGKLLSLSEPQFPHQHNGADNISSKGHW